MRWRIQLAFAAIVLVAWAGTDDLWARGFGGFHAPHLGGMPHPGGGFHPPGGLGGLHAPGGFAGGVHPGGLGGIHPGSLGGISHLAGAGFQPYGGYRPPTLGGGLGANRLGSSGIAGGGRDRLAAGDLGGGLNRPPTRGGLNSFLGLPSDGGLHSVSRAADGADATRGVARGPLGGVAAGGKVAGPRGGEAGRGVADGPRGNAVGGRAARGPEGNAVGQGFAAGPRGLRSISAARLNTGATAVRRNFHGYGFYSRDWYRRYPGAWYAAGWGADYAWRAATWDALGGWFDYDDVEPIYYDYGENIVYQDPWVIVNGENVGTAQQYYDQAQNLATTSVQADASSDEKWLPLGVFAMSSEGQDSANMDFQLAVNKAGVIRGNYTNPVSNHVEPIHGSVDKKTQRAAWSVGSNTKTVIETGISNLTKDEAPALVHFGADRTEQWMLVRIKKDGQATDEPSQQKN